MSVTRREQSAFIVGLSAQLRGRLNAVEFEARALRRALAVLEHPVARSPAQRRADHPSTPEAFRRRVLRAVEDDPGARASLLALSEGRDAQEIKQILEDL